MIASYLRSLTDAQVVVFIMIENIFLFLLSVGAGELLTSIFSSRLKSKPRQLATGEKWLAAGCVFNNCVVTIIGFLLWKSSVIEIRESASWLDDVVSFLVLFFVMDFAMFVFHRLAHWKPIYPYLHKSHHKFVEVRPLTLFALNPVETFGFGFLWLVVLFLCLPTWFAMIAYLVVNVIFGSLGHLAIEPLPQRWTKIPILNHLTTTTFHSLHHRDVEHNFGFYTTIWDRLGRSVFPKYEEIFGEASKAAIEKNDDSQIRR